MDTGNLIGAVGVALVALLINYLIIKGAVKAAIKEALDDRYLKGGYTPPADPTMIQTSRAE